MHPIRARLLHNRLLHTRLSQASASLRTAMLATLVPLAACVAPPGPASYGASPLNMGALPSQALPLPSPGGAAPRRVALLLPLSGPNADVGQSMLKAAQLSFAQPGSPELDARDTRGTPGGAAQAARDALAAGDTLVLGPLTSPETLAVAPLTRAANIPMLAFTSDATVAQPGVWPLGITPAQQVRRLVAAAQADNRTRIAAVLPQGAFGDAMATGLMDAAAAAGLPPPRVRRTSSTVAGISAGLRDVSDYAARHGGDAAPGALASPPAPVDALLLGVSGPMLSQIVPLLPASDLPPGTVRVLGPATWARDAANLPGLAGAWFAAPDPAPRTSFAQQYAARYNIPARDFASLAFDAAGIARVTAGPTGFDPASLTRSEGFAGADGVLALSLDGRVRRGLALMEVAPGGARLIQPSAPALAPGS